MLWTGSILPLAAQIHRDAFLPAADVCVGNGDLVLTMDLPGLTADDVDVDVRDGHLVVRGERRRPALPAGTRWAHTERAYGGFERRLRLPAGADPTRVAHTVCDGVLSVIVPRADRPPAPAIELDHDA